LFKFTLKNMFGLTGKMSEQQADKTSNKLANAVLILATGGALGIFIYAIRWW